MEIKELRQKARNELMRKALEKHSFLGLVKKSDYKHLLGYSLDQADRNIDLLDELQTTKAKLIFCEEELRLAKSQLETHKKIFTLFDFLSETEDIRLEEMIRCLVDQLPDDVQMYENIEAIYKEYSCSK